MELTAKQKATVVKMAKAGEFFPAIAKALKIKPYVLYRAYPGGVRVIIGKEPYAERGKPTVRTPKADKPKRKGKKAKASKVEW